MDESDIYDAIADEEADDLTEEQSQPLTEPLTEPMVEPMVEPMALAVYRGPSREEIEALKGTLKAANRDMTDAQFTVFLAAARHLGLDPLARQVVPIFQNGRMTVQTTIDGFRLIAERTRKYRGQLGPEWCGKDGVWVGVWLADEPPTAARVGVLRSDFAQPMWGVARTKSYHKDTPTWKAMPDVMIAKVAESLALRKTFPAELSGAYTDAELMIIDADPAPVTPAHQSRQARPSRAEPRQAPRPMQQTSQQETTAPKKTASPWATNEGYDPISDMMLRPRVKALGITNMSDFETLLAHVRDTYTAYTRAAIENEVIIREEALRKAQAKLAKEKPATADGAGADARDATAGGGHDLSKAFPASAAHSA